LSVRCLLVLALVTVGCGTPARPDGGPGSFIATPSTFAPFRTWTSFHDDGPPLDAGFPDSVLGPREQYINTEPPSGSTEFPVGTVIVEARESGNMHILAGVKRGGGFNAAGAVGWEWFELTEGDAGVDYQWRGVGPPPSTGEEYGGDPNGGCNTCHEACGASNDYVCSPKLQLANF
jgi:hypothetical protein